MIYSSSFHKRIWLFWNEMFLSRGRNLGRAFRLCSVEKLLFAKDIDSGWDHINKTVVINK